MLTEATKANLARKAHWADHVQFWDGVPLPSWIDISPVDLCNRACVFCPRYDPATYPNQALHMPLVLAEKMAAELRLIGYEGAVVLCGYGEPLLHPQIVEVVRCFAGVHVEIVTNGDRLTPALIQELVDAGTAYFVVSLYDGAHQIERFQAMFAEAGCGADRFILRDRWYRDDQDYGLKLTNRAGVVTTGRQEEVDPQRPCFYLAYQMTVDWNGDVLLCVQDWHKKVRYGNLAHQGLVEVWTSSGMHKRRMQLIGGRRVAAPCSGCNAGGTIHGTNHAAAWSR